MGILFLFKYTLTYLANVRNYDGILFLDNSDANMQKWTQYTMYIDSKCLLFFISKISNFYKGFKLRLC